MGTLCMSKMCSVMLCITFLNWVNFKGIFLQRNCNEITPTNISPFLEKRVKFFFVSEWVKISTCMSLCELGRKNDGPRYYSNISCFVGGYQVLKIAHPYLRGRRMWHWRSLQLCKESNATHFYSQMLHKRWWWFQFKYYLQLKSF